MVHFKLSYFNGRALGEPIRQMLHIRNVPFEDVRVFREDGSWNALKPKTPFGQVPVLEVDGFEIPQSAAIGRYVAKKFGFYGNSDEEGAWIDAIVDQFKDFFVSWVPIHVARREGKPQEEQDRIRREVSEPAVESFFAVLKKILSASSSGFLVGDSLSWADLVVSDSLTTLECFGFYAPRDEPMLSAFQRKVNSTDGLKQWLERRPHSDI